MKNFLILALLISSISLANESIGIGKNEKLNLWKESGSHIQKNINL
ncbi:MULTISPECIES: hypothetical protein [unclassified Cetobacterium]|nr:MULTISPECIES: hypothetical protein [unclassified Cetobacterium]